MFNVDLADFFGTINFGRVRGYFMADSRFALHKDVATLVAQIACHDNALPQGSPCSPVISNLIGHILDVKLLKLAKKAGCTYTRYADDLSFSTGKAQFPEEIAVRDNASPHGWRAGDGLGCAIAEAGFRINERKTRMQYRTSRQEVTGLVVNKKVNVRKEYRHVVRAMVHRLLTMGEFTLQGAVGDAKVCGESVQLHGMLGFIDKIDLINARADDSKKPLHKKELTYRRFLLFDQFYRAERPTIVCEGKTDVVYLIHALRSLAAECPTLASMEANGKVALKVRLFKSTNRSTGRILGLNGGTADIKDFITHYRADTRRFGAPGGKSPVIVVVDRDDGAKPIYSVVKQIIGRDVGPDTSHLHIFGNLYLVTIPSIGGTRKTIIEDYFDDDVRNVVLDGKSFSPNNEFNSRTHYGKSDFAHKVVRPLADKIDFSKFLPLLQQIAGVVDAHSSLIGQ